MEKNKRRINTEAAAYADKLIDRAVYDALFDVFVNGAFCARALTAALKTLRDERSHAFVTSAFYGVLDKNVRLDKVIACLCDKPPQKAAAVVLKIGLFYVGYANMPPYAAVNRTVELSKTVGGVFSGFINAVLKKSIGFQPTFKSELERFSYEYSTPEWLCKTLISDYSEIRAAAILGADIPDKTHIRPVKCKIGLDDLCKTVGGERSEYGCYCDRAAMDRLAAGSYAVQSLSSVKAVRTYVDGIDGGKVLDLCAAPGGKAVYVSELGKFDVTACDVYPHKIDLMRGYARKLGAKIKTVLNDATVKNTDFIDGFDLVIADCPCSGTGTLKSKPDIMLRRKPSDIAELNRLQTKILDNAAVYCKRGGVLCYSTCSVLKSENERISKAFLQAHKNYTMMDERTLLPDTDNCDGFYIARFKREQ